MCLHHLRYSQSDYHKSELTWCCHLIWETENVHLLHGVQWHNKEVNRCQDLELCSPNCRFFQSFIPNCRVFRTLYMVLNCTISPRTCWCYGKSSRAKRQVAKVIHGHLKLTKVFSFIGGGDGWCQVVVEDGFVLEVVCWQRFWTVNIAKCLFDCSFSLSWWALTGCHFKCVGQELETLRLPFTLTANVNG